MTLQLVVAFTWLTLLVLTLQGSAHAKSQNGDFYKNLLANTKRQHGSCEVYNGTACSKYLSGKTVYVRRDRSLKLSEKRLHRWFKQNKKTGQIGRECWPHAEALTCMHYFPECNSAHNRPIKTSLCSNHCSFLKNKICKGEYKRAKHSSYFQRFMPLCEEVSLIDDSKGEYCFFLPTLNLMKGPILYAEPRKPFHGTEGESTVLKCIFGIKNFVWTKETAILITEGTWYQGNKRIIGNKRLRTRTKQKGKARLLMLLKIHDVSRKDKGNYRCMITFGNKTVSGHATLTVNRVVVRPIEGKCTKYGGGICSPYFNEEHGNHLVFEEKMNSMNLVNKQLEEFIKKLKYSKQLSERCQDFGQAVLCYNKFKKCHNETKQITPSLCRDDCHLFKEDYCKEELKLISQEKTILAMYIPDCDTLQQVNTGCISLSNNPSNIPLLKNHLHNDVREMHCYDEDSPTNYLGAVSMTHTGMMCDSWRRYPDYSDIDHDYCRNFGENRPWCFVNGKKKYCSIKSCRPTCYRNRGDDYYGKVAVTKLGRKCLPWNKVAEDFLQSNIDHNYCRNFENDMEAPWCYVDYEKSRELCDIPRCVAKVTKSKTSVSLVVYIVPAIVGATAFLFSLLLFIFYMKNKKLLRVRKSKEVMVSESENSDLPGVNTLSTAGSVGKESPEVECFESINNPPLEIRKAKKNKKFQSVPEVKETRLINLIKMGDCKLGQLWQGEFVENKNTTIPILMKKIKAETRSNIISEFRLEMNMLRALKHRNLQNVVCVSTMSEVPFIAFEWKHTLDLKEFLKGNNVDSQDFFTQCIFQVASGLEYMHNHRVLHRDLAARSCSITQSGHIRISKSELGMCRYPDDYANLPMLGWAPVRWLSPETIQTGEFRSATDIYMLGVLIWELYSNGIEPYFKLTNEEVMDYVIEGHRLQKPRTCPLSVWQVVEQCWALPICHRPPVTVLKEHFRITTPTAQRRRHDNNNNDSNKTC